ncbi:MAG: hypothetical protein MJA27_27810 [Pseudanabaenales cyanobacterium]|nr:hypothetical protein [Pseudanabaenales cyanobacterium]
MMNYATLSHHSRFLRCKSASTFAFSCGDNLSSPCCNTCSRSPSGVVPGARRNPFSVLFQRHSYQTRID